MGAGERAEEKLPDAKVTIDAEEGALRVGSDVVLLMVHEGLGLHDVEVSLSDVDSVQFTRSTIRDVGTVEVTAKGGKRLVATIPEGKASKVLKALVRVEEDAKPKLAANAEKRVTK